MSLFEIHLGRLVPAVRHQVGRRLELSQELLNLIVLVAGALDPWRVLHFLWLSRIGPELINIAGLLVLLKLGGLLRTELASPLAVHLLLLVAVVVL